MEKQIKRSAESGSERRKLLLYLMEWRSHHRDFKGAGFLGIVNRMGVLLVRNVFALCYDKIKSKIKFENAKWRRKSAEAALLRMSGFSGLFSPPSPPGKLVINLVIYNGWYAIVLLLYAQELTII